MKSETRHPKQVRNSKVETLILFVKYPKKGFVKTRLAKTVDENIVPDLYRCFVSDILQTIRMIGIPIYIFYAGATRRQMTSWLGNNDIFLEQDGEDLGMRMFNAFRHVFEKGYVSAVLIGSDSPDLPYEIFGQAFDHLQTSDMVIGPSSDGGYYLIGLRKNTLSSCLFQNIPWSTDAVMAATMINAKALNLNASLLPEWEDVDDADSLSRLYHRNCPVSGCQTTMMLLNRLNLPFLLPETVTFKKPDITSEPPCSNAGITGAVRIKAE